MAGSQLSRSTRRTTLAASGAMLGSVILAACGAGGSSQTGGEAASKPHAPLTLRTNIATPGSVTYPATERADAATKQKYPWLTVIHEGQLPGDYIANVITQGAAGTLPDIIYAQGTQIQHFITRQLAISMSPYLAKDKAFDLNDFPKVAIEMYSRGGQIYAIPYDHGPQMLWYNADLFKKYGVQPPTNKWTFDDMLAAAKRLTVEGQTWGLINAGPSGGWTMPSYLGPWGGFWVDDTETKTGIDDTGSITSLQYWMDLFFKHKVNPVPGTTTGDPYLEGKVGMTFGGPWTYRGWIGKLTFESPIADWPIGPAGKRISASMGSGYPISKDTKYRDESWLYMGEYVGKDMNRSLMGQFVQTGFGTPVRFSIMKEFEKSKFAMPNVQIVTPAESYSVIGRPISPIKPELDRIWSEERAKLLKQEISVKDMLGTVKQRMLPELAKNKAG